MRTRVVVIGLLALSVAFDLTGQTGSVKGGVLKKTSQAQPDDSPLSDKDAAVACGNVLNLDKVEGAIKKLDLIARLDAITNNGGITEEELKDFNFGHGGNLDDWVFNSYSRGYSTWDQPTNVERAIFEKAILQYFAKNSGLRHLSPSERVTFVAKFKRLMFKAFDLGRLDAKTSPCPFLTSLTQTPSVSTVKPISEYMRNVGLLYIETVERPSSVEQLQTLRALEERINIQTITQADKEFYETGLKRLGHLAEIRLSELQTRFASIQSSETQARELMSNANRELNNIQERLRAEERDYSEGLITRKAYREYLESSMALMEQKQAEFHAASETLIEQEKLSQQNGSSTPYVDCDASLRRLIKAGEYDMGELENGCKLPGEVAQQIAMAPASSSPSTAPIRPVNPAPPLTDLDQAMKVASDNYRLDPDLLCSLLNVGAEFNMQPISPQRAAQHLRELLERYNFDILKALAAYKVGPERVDQYSGIPPEASAYVTRVIRDFNKKKTDESDRANAYKH